MRSFFKKLISQLDAEAYAISKKNGNASRFESDPEYRAMALRAGRRMAFGLPIFYALVFTALFLSSLTAWVKVPGLILVSFLLFVVLIKISFIYHRKKTYEKE